MLLNILLFVAICHFRAPIVIPGAATLVGWVVVGHRVARLP